MTHFLERKSILGQKLKIESIDQSQALYTTGNGGVEESIIILF